MIIISTLFDKKYLLKKINHKNFKKYKMEIKDSKLQHKEKPINKFNKFSILEEDKMVIEQYKF